MKTFCKVAVCCIGLTALATGVWYANYRCRLASFEAALPPDVSLSSGVNHIYSTGGRLSSEEKSGIEKVCWQVLALVGIKRSDPLGGLHMEAGSGVDFVTRYTESRCSLGEALDYYGARVMEGKLYDYQGREIVLYLIRSHRLCGEVSQGEFSFSDEPAIVPSQTVICVDE